MSQALVLVEITEEAEALVLTFLPSMAAALAALGLLQVALRAVQEAVPDLRQVALVPPDQVRALVAPLAMVQDLVTPAVLDQHRLMALGQVRLEEAPVVQGQDLALLAVVPAEVGWVQAQILVEAQDRLAAVVLTVQDQVQLAEALEEAQAQKMLADLDLDQPAGVLKNLAGQAQVPLEDLAQLVAEAQEDLDQATLEDRALDQPEAVLVAEAQAQVLPAVVEVQAVQVRVLLEVLVAQDLDRLAAADLEVQAPATLAVRGQDQLVVVEALADLALGRLEEHLVAQEALVEDLALAARVVPDLDQLAVVLEAQAQEMLEDLDLAQLEVEAQAQEMLEGLAQVLPAVALVVQDPDRLAEALEVVVPAAQVQVPLVEVPEAVARDQAMLEDMDQAQPVEVPEAVAQDPDQVEEGQEVRAQVLLVEVLEGLDLDQLTVE